MSVNRYQPYLIVLFEDQAYKDIFLGFEMFDHKQISMKPVFQGFDDVFFQLTNSDSLTSKELRQYNSSYVLALIDADLDSQSESKINQLRDALPNEYKDRIFIMGSKYEAEHIKRAIINEGKWEKISQKLENSCRAGDCKLWEDEMLKHNIGEIISLKKVFKL